MNVVPLAAIAEKIDYGVTASSSKANIGPKFLRITDIQDGEVDWNKVPFCGASNSSIARSQLQVGDIVFARTGATTGKSYLIRSCPENAVFASYLIRVRGGKNVDPRYLARFFQSADYWRQLSSKTVGAAQPGVNASKLGELLIPLPPVSEQERIAAILDQADELRRKRRVTTEIHSRFDHSIFLELFGDPARNPQGWPRGPLRNLATIFSDGPFGSNLKSSHYASEGIRVIRLQNIGVGRLIDDDKAFISEEHFARLSRHKCLPGDVLVGTLGDPNLRACIQPDYLPIALNKADCVQIRVNPKVATPEFLCTLLNIPATEQMAHRLVLGQTRARISMGRLRDLVVPIPPVELQRHFSQRIRELNISRSKLISATAETEVLFASLQRRAFQGEL